MAPIGSAPPAAALPAATSLGTVALTVSDLARARTFYEDVLGLEGRPLGGGDLALGAAGGPALVTLHGDPRAPARDPRAPGLFHLAILLPSRRALAHALRRVAAAGRPLAGASDHLVSEALYLSDPDGNGLELYRDRPREQWRHDAAGAPQMATLALDLRDLAAEAARGAEPGARDDGDVEGESAAPPGTRIGHVHLQVSDLADAEAFYHDVLGFDVTVRAYPGALFVSAGGYHHHLGLNTWNSAGAAPPAPGSVGLRSFEVVVPDGAALEGIRARLAGAGASVAPASDGHALATRDPFGMTVRMRSA